jgi:GTP-binding protein HflX
MGISARTGEGLGALLERMEAVLTSAQRRVELVIPYERYEAMRLIRQCGKVLSEEHEDSGTRLTVLIGEDDLARVKRVL